MHTARSAVYLRPGQGVRTFAVQTAVHLGARVTGVCSARHADLVRRLGAGQVIDFTRGTARYDLVLQLGGTYSPGAVRSVLTARGTLIQSSGDGSRWFGPLGNIIKAAALSPFVGQTLKPSPPRSPPKPSNRSPT